MAATSAAAMPFSARNAVTAADCARVNASSAARNTAGSGPSNCQASPAANASASRARVSAGYSARVQGPNSSTVSPSVRSIAISMLPSRTVPVINPSDQRIQRASSASARSCVSDSKPPTSSVTITPSGTYQVNASA